MSTRGRASRRPPREWAIRGLFAAGIAALGVVAVMGTIAAVVHGRNPALAHRLAPGDGRWSAALATSLSGAEATAADRREADALARTALRQDPTAVAAVSTLGINAQLRGDTLGARRLFAYAQRLSRRNLATQLWAIEDAVARNDVPGALRQYDIALRASRSASELLFPVLAAAIADPAPRLSLLRTLKTRPGWGPAFADYAAANASPSAAAQLFRAMRRMGLPVSEGEQAAVLGRLLATDAIAQAWAYYATFHPGVDRRASRDPAFTATLVAPSAFDWVPLSDGGLVTAIQGDARGGLFDFSAPTSVGGPLLQQLQVLPAGAYRVEGHSSGIEQAPDALPYWQLTCRDGRELGRVTIPNSANSGGNFRGDLRVPADCPVQLLVLVARPSDAVGGLSGQIDRVRLHPVAN